ncbi:hypothetical protein ACFQU8_09760 [Lentibacillus kimchii]|uniref:Uncharacterized protein n=2 Tax=Lentibacillus kimchii TaxID=1542911 RepID=A0ABW2UYT5_9BACI
MSEFLGLPLDTEVPYENKLIVTTSEVASALKGRQFWDNKSVSIPSIEHTEEFLNSVNVKYRLILSAFTTVPYLIEGDIKLIKSIEELAFLRLIKLFEAITDKHAFLIEELVNFLVTDGDVSGKDYLGYKSNDINIEAYRAFINGQLTNLHESVELTSGHFKIESLNKLFDEKYQEFLSLGGKEQYV